jgi:hypothetical protein
MRPAKLFDRIITAFTILLGFGEDVITLLASLDDRPVLTESELEYLEYIDPNEDLIRLKSHRATLSKLGVMWPEEVNRSLKLETRRTFIVENFLPADCIAMCAGDSGIGKSPLLMLLALCVASGTPFLGMEIKQPQVVLYLDLENSLADTQLMRNALCKSLGLAQAPEHFYLVTEPPDTAKLIKMVETTGAKLIVADSLRSLEPSVADNNKAAGQWLKNNRELIHKYGCTFLFNHHLRKTKTEQDPVKLNEDSRVLDWMQEVEGARALVNQTDVRIAIEEHAEGLKMKWNRRVHGDSPLYLLERVFDEDSEPRGYKAQTGTSLLTVDQRAAFDKLGRDFRFSDAKSTLNKSDHPTNLFIKKCLGADLIVKMSRSLGYHKVE